MNKQAILHIVTILLVCVISYGNCFNHDFLLDDHNLLFNAGGLEHREWSGTFFTESFRGFYRPMGVVFLKLAYDMSKRNPNGYNIVNLILFGLIGVLFYWMLRQLFQAPTCAFLASCFYCAHPINNMLVNYKTAGMLSLFVIFLQLGMITFFTYLGRQRRGFYLLSLGFYLLGLLTHEMSMMLPVYILVASIFLQKTSLKRAVFLCLPYLGCFILYLLVRSVISDLRPVDTLFRMKISFGSCIASLMPLLIWYLSKLVVPYKIIFLLDGLVIKEDVLIWNILFVLIVIAVLYLCFFKWKKGPQAFGLALFVSGFIPFVAASFIYTRWFRTVIIEPHWFAFSSIGFFILLTHGLMSFRKKNKDRLWQVSIILLIMCLSLLTRRHNLYWRDEKTFCTYWLSVNPYDRTAKSGLQRAIDRENRK